VLCILERQLGVGCNQELFTVEQIRSAFECFEFLLQHQERPEWPVIVKTIRRYETKNAMLALFCEAVNSRIALRDVAMQASNAQNGLNVREFFPKLSDAAFLKTELEALWDLSSGPLALERVVLSAQGNTLLPLHCAYGYPTDAANLFEKAVGRNSLLIAVFVLSLPSPSRLLKHAVYRYLLSGDNWVIKLRLFDALNHNHLAADFVEYWANIFSLESHGSWIEPFLEPNESLLELNQLIGTNRLRIYTLYCAATVLFNGFTAAFDQCRDVLIANARQSPVIERIHLEPCSAHKISVWRPCQVDRNLLAQRKRELQMLMQSKMLETGDCLVLEFAARESKQRVLYFIISQESKLQPEINQ
jgi:hypothetical protein